MVKFLQQIELALSNKGSNKSKRAIGPLLKAILSSFSRLRQAVQSLVTLLGMNLIWLVSINISSSRLQPR
jgi:hypothetical protein